MLLKITEYSKIDERKLMDIYSESNFENTDYFYPNEQNKEKAVLDVESGFLDYLKNEFFLVKGSTYWVLEEDGMWISALRTNLINPNSHYIEALETRPDKRRQGYALKLLQGVIEELKKNGPFNLYACVSKRNEASINAHLKSGFKQAEGDGYNYLLNAFEPQDYGFEFIYKG